MAANAAINQMNDRPAYDVAAMSSSAAARLAVPGMRVKRRPRLSMTKPDTSAMGMLIAAIALLRIPSTATLASAP